MDCDDRLQMTPLFHSGELDAAGMTSFRAHLELCRACAEDIRQQRDVDARLREEVFSEAEDTARLQASVRRAVRIATRRRRTLAIAACIALTMAAATIAYRVQSRNGLLSEAALDHHREVVDHARRIWATDAGGIESLAERAGLGGTLLSMLAPHGYHCERAKFCRLGGSSFLHVVYSDGVKEFSIFLRKQEASPSGTVEQADMGSEHVAAFRTVQMDVLIVTDESGEASLRLAESAARVL